jgi:isopenicillin N synthase-like dioxygenase
VTFTSVPQIDLREADGLEHRVLSACHEVGFFTLVGHGVPDEFMDRWFESAATFFALPEATKALIDKRLSPHFRGWERVGAELTNNQPDMREQIDMSSEHPARALDVTPAYLRLDGPNQWPPHDVLPGYRALATEFFDRMGAVAQRVMRLLAVGLGLDELHFDRVFGERPLSFVKVIRYPETPAGAAGVNPHHDAGFLTVLAQHGVGGLQALNPDGDWIDVPPERGAFVINTGEMLQEMTGNYVVATTHRVIATQPRLSSGYFHGPDLRTRLDPLPLPERFGLAVAASPRHASAGFMAKADELASGIDGIGSATGAGVYGQQLWNYYRRSYPENMRTHHPDVAEPASA